MHRHLLEQLLQFLHQVTLNSEDRTLAPGEEDEAAEGGVIKGNLMNANNLAVCLGPNILREYLASGGKVTLGVDESSRKDLLGSSPAASRGVSIGT